MGKTSSGWPAIYRPKHGQRVQGTLTRYGTRLLEAARRQLARHTKRPLKRVSDADAIEFLARGKTLP